MRITQSRSERNLKRKGSYDHSTRRPELVGLSVLYSEPFAGRFSSSRKESATTLAYGNRAQPARQRHGGYRDDRIRCPTIQRILSPKLLFL